MNTLGNLFANPTVSTPDVTAELRITKKGTEYFNAKENEVITVECYEMYRLAGVAHYAFNQTVKGFNDELPLKDCEYFEVVDFTVHTHEPIEVITPDAIAIVHVTKKGEEYFNVNAGKLVTLRCYENGECVQDKTNPYYIIESDSLVQELPYDDIQLTDSEFFDLVMVK